MDLLIQLQRETISEVKNLAAIEQKRLDVEMERLCVDREQLAATKQLLRIKEESLVLRKLAISLPGDCSISIEQ